METNRLITEKLPRLYLQYVLPALAAMVLDGIQSIADGIFIGQFAGAGAMASVNIANPYYQAVIGLSMVLCTGTMSAAGRALGAGDRQKARRLFRSALGVLAGLSMLLGLAGALAARPLAAFLGADATLIQDSAAYIGTLALFVPVICFKILLGFMGRLIEKPHLYLMGTVVTLVTNIGLDYVAVKLMGLGTAGAAAATGLAYLAGLCVVAGPYLKRKTVLNIWQGRFSGREIARAAYNGASEGVTYAAGALTMFLLNRSFMALSGPEGVAAFTVISYLGNFVTLLMFGMADGVSPILSSNCGAGQQERIRRTLRTALWGNACLGAGLCAVFWLGGPWLIRLFLGAEAAGPVAAMAVHGSRIYGLCFLLNGFNIVHSGYHTALGHAGASIAIAASRGAVFIALGVWALGALWGLDGVWAALPFAESMTALLCLGLWQKERSRQRQAA